MESTEEMSNEKWEAIVDNKCNEYIGKKEYDKLYEYLTNLKQYRRSLSTARHNKIIIIVYHRILVSYYNVEELLIFIEKLIKWAENKKTLKIELKCNQIRLFLRSGMFGECLAKIKEVSVDLKKYDDTKNLIELYIYESQAYYDLQDYARARASLTSARALFVSSSCPYGQQAQIDMLNGMYLCDDHAYSTAVSYFMESLEGFMQDKNTDMAKIILRYLILCKIMNPYFKTREGDDERTETEIGVILNSKHAKGLKDDEYVKLLVSIADVCIKRDLHQYNEILVSRKVMIESDAFIFRHLCCLYDVLFENNILKIIEPYSHVKIKFIAEKMKFEEGIIETQLRKLILEKSINGVLDHVSQCLILINENNDNTHKFLQKDIMALKNFFFKHK